MSNVAKMPFGKHKGDPLDKVPEDYLLWVYENVNNLRGDLKTYLDENIEDIKTIVSIKNKDKD